MRTSTDENILFGMLHFHRYPNEIKCCETFSIPVISELKNLYFFINYLRHKLHIHKKK